MGSLSLFQGIFPTQGSNPGLSHCEWILYQLSYEGRLLSSASFYYLILFSLCWEWVGFLDLGAGSIHFFC